MNKNIIWKIYRDEILYEKELNYIKEPSIVIILSESNKKLVDYIKNKFNSKKLKIISTTIDHKDAIKIVKPLSIPQLSILIYELINKGNIDSLFFESPERLVVFNNPILVEKFIYYLVNSLENREITGVLVSSESEMTNIIVPKVSKYLNCEFI
jgi:hypothetical protein